MPTRLLLVVALLPTLALAQPAPPKPQQPAAPSKKPAAPPPQDPNRPIPPAGKPLPEADRAELDAGAKKLGQDLAALRTELAGKPALLALLPDVQIYHNAVRYPLTYDEPIDAKAARQALADAADRVAQLRAGDPKWTRASGPRGYVSAIDGSVQPYLLSIPANFDPNTRYRADYWCHGRGETLTELAFLRGKPGEHAPTTHFVVYLYGRYCCANKFAGEVDCLEAMADAERRYPLDPAKRVTIGFSMGGAAVWQFATHYADLWAAASPGAGFSEPREFLKIPQAEVDAMRPWQRALWHWYDCTDWVENLAMLPTVAYAGEIDGQKQASDVMLRAAEPEHVKIERLIGPKTGHKYEPETKKQLDARLAEIVAKGRDPVPAEVRFTTYTLRYNRMYWVTVLGLEKHWERARVAATIEDSGRILIRTQNVTALSIDLPAGRLGDRVGPTAKVLVDGREFAVPVGPNRASLSATFDRKVGPPFAWSLQAPAKAPSGLSTQDSALKKISGLQGPIDDAFMAPFLIVQPTGQTGNAAVDQWVAAEFKHAVDHWRKQFRGEARVKKDTDVTPDDIANYHLVCFGTPASNAVLAKAADKLPAKWNAGQLTLAGKSFDAATHVPALIYPNPLNPAKYVVLNSGFTFREFDYYNNARQTPKLPDYAVIDTATPITPKAPGAIPHAGFFDEQWR